MFVAIPYIRPGKRRFGFKSGSFFTVTSSWELSLLSSYLYFDLHRVVTGRRLIRPPLNTMFRNLLQNRYPAIFAKRFEMAGHMSLLAYGVSVYISETLPDRVFTGALIRGGPKGPYFIPGSPFGRRSPDRHPPTRSSGP